MAIIGVWRARHGICLFDLRLRSACPPRAPTERPPCVPKPPVSDLRRRIPYTVSVLLAWSAGTCALALRTLDVASGNGVELALRGLVCLAQSTALFYLLGFVWKSAVYLLSRRETRADVPGGTSRATAVLYLTAGDYDREAVDSLLSLDAPEHATFLVHDDGDDEEARRAIEKHVKGHPNARSWNPQVWHRPWRDGDKAGAINWVLRRLDPSIELVLLCDNDSIACSADAVIRASAEFDDPSVAIVQFRNVGQPDDGATSFGRRLACAIDVFDVFATAQSRYGYMPFFGHNAVLRRSHVREVGGFTPGCFSDDLDLSIRLSLRGREIRYRPDIVFAERQPPGFCAFRRRARKWAHGCVQVMRSRLWQVCSTRGVPLSTRLGMLEFMGFYPAQALLLVAFAVSAFVLPFLSTASPSTPSQLGLGVAVLAALFAPTLAWSFRHRRLREWPELAWTCALVYGGGMLATARGVLDGIAGRRRRWVPTNLTEGGRAVPWYAFLESTLGLSLFVVPWTMGDAAIEMPASYVFVGVFLFSPLTHAAYRAKATTGQPSRARRRFLLRGAVVLLAGGGLASFVFAGELTVSGDRLLRAGEDFAVRGMHYSPWPPGTGPGPESRFPEDELVDADLASILELGANVVYVHEFPRRVVEKARERGLLTFYAFDIPWNDTSDEAFERQLERIVDEVESLRGTRGLAAWILGHEVPPWVVQQLGADVVSSRLARLAEAVRAVDPETLVAHANWPQTLDIRHDAFDLACFNLYPAWPYEVSVMGFGPYLRKVLAPRSVGKPLVITEFGINSLEAGEERQAEVVRDCWVEIVRGPAVGGVVFGWCDEWWKNYDNPIDGKGYWEREYDADDASAHDADPEEYYGIVRSDRSPKAAFHAVAEMWRGDRARSAWPWAVLLSLAVLTAVSFGVIRRSRPDDARADQDNLEAA